MASHAVQAPTSCIFHHTSYTQEWCILCTLASGDMDQKCVEKHFSLGCLSHGSRPWPSWALRIPKTPLIWPSWNKKMGQKLVKDIISHSGCWNPIECTSDLIPF